MLLSVHIKNDNVNLPNKLDWPSAAELVAVIEVDSIDAAENHFRTSDWVDNANVLWLDNSYKPEPLRVGDFIVDENGQLMMIDSDFNIQKIALPSTKRHEIGNVAKLNGAH